MKCVVVYKSKTGFTKKYAEWIADELSADLFEASQITSQKLASYDAIVYGGGLYAVGINGINLLLKNLELLQGRRIAVFATGASPARPEAIQEVLDQNFTPAQRKYLEFFYMRGGLAPSNLGLFDKVLMFMLNRKLVWKKSRGEELSGDERGMLHAYSNSVDFSRRENIKALTAYIKERQG